VSQSGDIRDYLAADGLLSGLLRGGIYADTTVSRQNTPLAFDENGEIKPCLLVNEEVETPWGPFKGSSRLFVRVFFYQHAGYDAIYTAMERVFDLMHRQKALALRWELLHVDDIRGQEDQALSCSLAMSRYQVLRDRGVSEVVIDFDDEYLMAWEEE
jgi:hypothetical protein